MPKAARLGDTAGGHGCFPPTAIIAGSSDVSINGKPAARKGDAALLHACPCPYVVHGVHGRTINAGSSTVSINGKPAARVGDAIDCGGSVASGSGDVLIGDTPYSSTTQSCGEGAAQEQSTFLKILPLAEPISAVWNSPVFSPDMFSDLIQEQLTSTAVDLAVDNTLPKSASTSASSSKLTSSSSNKASSTSSTSKV